MAKCNQLTPLPFKRLIAVPALCYLSPLLLLLCRMFIFCGCVIVQMSVDCRRQIVKRALKYARQQQSAKKKTSDTLGSVLRHFAIFASHRTMQRAVCFTDTLDENLHEDNALKYYRPWRRTLKVESYFSEQCSF